jgi:hypothetical protein
MGDKVVEGAIAAAVAAVEELLPQLRGQLRKL